jgi:hypothetical protein
VRSGRSWVLNRCSTLFHHSLLALTPAFKVIQRSSWGTTGDVAIRAEPSGARLIYGPVPPTGSASAIFSSEASSASQARNLSSGHFVLSNLHV